MVEIINALSNSPLLAALGLMLILAIIFLPAALSLAGLTGAQILALFTRTMRFIIEVIKESRKK